MKTINNYINWNDFDKKILECATIEFINYGYHKANLDRVAKVLNIGKGTIYRHFGNKLKLFICTIINVLEKIKSIYKNINEIDSFDKAINYIIENQLEILKKYGRLFEIFFSEEKTNIFKSYENYDKEIKDLKNIINQNDKFIINKLIELIINEQNKKRIESKINPTIYANLINETIKHNIIFALCHFNEINNNKENIDNYLNELKIFILKGINYKI